MADSVAEEATRVSDELAADRSGMLRTLLVVLPYENSRQFYDVRRLRSELADRDTPVTDELGRLSELFVEIDAARQFLKTGSSNGNWPVCHGS